MIQPTGAFHRDRATWAAYVLLTLLMLQISLIGPVLPFLRAEMGLSYTQGALHTSAFALGMMAAGFLCGPLERRIGRKAAMVVAALGSAIGFSIIVVARTPVLTIVAAGGMGLVGAMNVVFVPLVLLGRHGRESGRAIAEANLMSYLGALIAPVAVWLFTDTIGWRAVAGLGWAMMLIAVATLRGARLPSDQQLPGHTDSPLGRAYWIYWFLLTLSVGAEFCFGVWSASFLEKVSGLVREHAVIGSSLFAFGVLSGRVLGMFGIRRLGAWRLALVSLFIALGGFFVFWLSRVAGLTLFGLALSGLGIANLYAASLTLALAAEPGNASRAAARSSMASGLAIILTPLILGALADSVGLFAGYAIVPVLVLAGLASLGLGARASRRQEAAAARLVAAG